MRKLTILFIMLLSLSCSSDRLSTKSSEENPLVNTTSQEMSKYEEELAERLMTQYIQHPKVTTIGDIILTDGYNSEPMRLDEVAAFIWKQIEVPRTMADLVRAITKEYDVDRQTAAADIIEFLGSLTDSGIAIKIPPGSELPAAAKCESEAAALLSEAYRQLKAEQWQAALSLCIEARKDVTYGPFADLNILIARYHLGRFDGFIEQTQELMPKLPISAQPTCSVLALLAAHRIGDLKTAKAIAMDLARDVEIASDLPALPEFVALLEDNYVFTVERSPKPILEVIQQLQTCQDNSGEESEVLCKLAKQYRSQLTFSQ